MDLHNDMRNHSNSVHGLFRRLSGNTTFPAQGTGNFFGRPPSASNGRREHIFSLKPRNVVNAPDTNRVAGGPVAQNDKSLLGKRSDPWIGTYCTIPGYHDNNLHSLAYLNMLTNRPNIKQEVADPDADAGKHGNWMLKHAKPRLNQFMKENRVKGIYKFDETGAGNMITAKLTLTVPQLQYHLVGTGTDINKHVATEKCALSLVWQLFDNGIIGACYRMRKEEEVRPYLVPRKRENEVYDESRTISTVENVEYDPNPPGSSKRMKIEPVEGMSSIQDQIQDVHKSLMAEIQVLKGENQKLSETNALMQQSIERIENVVNQMEVQASSLQTTKDNIGLQDPAESGPPTPVPPPGPNTSPVTYIILPDEQL